MTSPALAVMSATWGNAPTELERFQVESDSGSGVAIKQVKRAAGLEFQCSHGKVIRGAGRVVAEIGAAPGELMLSGPLQDELRRGDIKKCVLRATIGHVTRDVEHVARPSLDKSARSDGQIGEVLGGRIADEAAVVGEGAGKSNRGIDRLESAVLTTLPVKMAAFCAAVIVLPEEFVTSPVSVHTPVWGSEFVIQRSQTKSKSAAKLSGAGCGVWDEGHSFHAEFPQKS
jgi:hypothetical protein